MEIPGDVGVQDDAGDDAGDAGGPPCVPPMLDSPPVAPANSVFGNMRLALTGPACTETCFQVTVERADFDGENTRVCVAPGEDGAQFWHHSPLFTADVPSALTVDGIRTQVGEWSRTVEFARFIRGSEVDLEFEYDGTASVDIDNEGQAVFATTEAVSDDDTDGLSDVVRWNLDGSFTPISLNDEEAREPRISNDGKLVAYFEDTSSTVRYAYESESAGFRRGAFTTGADTTYRPGVGALDLGRNGDGHLFALGAGGLHTGARTSSQLALADADIPLTFQPVPSNAFETCGENGANPSAISLASGDLSIFVSYTNPCLFYFCEGANPFMPTETLPSVHTSLQRENTP